MIIAGLWNTVPSHNSHLAPLICNTGRSKTHTHLSFKSINCVNQGDSISSSPETVSHVDKDSVKDWELEFLGKSKSLGLQSLNKSKKEPNSKLLDETDGFDWCLRARKVALKTIESRGLSRRMEEMVIKKKKKKKNKKKKKDGARKKDLELEDDEFDSESDFEGDFEMGLIRSESSDLRRSVGSLAGGMFEERREMMMEEFVNRLSTFGGPSDRRKEISLNKAIVEARTADEVLDVTGEMIMAVAKGLSPSPLTPLNIATALHRIAKNMEKVSLMNTHRLAFARRKEMAMLVGIGMTALPECSAQGISNIAWALSKIGGDLLYLSEMDRVAEVASAKVGEFNSQNVANIAGAFASMKHSASDLFSVLSTRAAEICSTFREQELAQVLWAFASLNEPAEDLINSLDETFKDLNQYEFCLKAEASKRDEYGIMGCDSDIVSEGSLDHRVLRLNRDQLGNIAWSYAVLGQLNRTFFANIWRTLSCFENIKISDQHKEDIMFASQVHLVNQCLKVEHQHSQLSLKSDIEERICSAVKSKRFNQKTTSSFQKEVLRLLVGTGLDWQREYAVDGYTLDAVVADKKIALEIDGPTHFSRNTGMPLGHTMLKRRYIAAAGWKLSSLSHQEWEELQGEFEQLDYLRKILKDHLDESNGDKL